MAILSIVLISLLSVVLPINARPQYADDANGGSVGQNAGSLGTNSVFRNDFHKLPPTVKTSFIVMMLTSFNKTINDLNNACLQILAGQSVQTEMCTELKNMETQRQEAFQEFDNSLQDGPQKTLVDQFNQGVIKNNDMTFGDKCTKFFELLSHLDEPTKALLIKNMASKYQGHGGTPTYGGSNGMSGGMPGSMSGGMSGSMSGGMPGSMSGGMPGSMSGTPGAGVFSGAMAPSSTGGAATTSGGSVNPCSIIENFMAKTAAYVESHQTTGPPSS